MPSPAVTLPRPSGRPSLLSGARAILDAGLWCVVEVRRDVAAQSWEPHLLVCRDDADAAAAVAADCIRREPDRAVRLAGYTRDTLCRADVSPLRGG